jgi:hypothetical protein
VELDALEAALRTRLDPDTLAVYADHLQSIGDLRGELIALELEIARTGTTLARELRRDELLQYWLGMPRVGTPRFGFLELDLSFEFTPPPLLDAALDGPGGRFARTITIAGRSEFVAMAMSAISRAPRPWLVALAVHQRHDRVPAIWASSWSSLVAAAPHLDTLELTGDGIVEELHHPSVRRLRLTGLDGFDIIELPAVTELDLEFSTTEYADVAISIIDNLPALTRLDLSRSGPADVVFALLGGLALRHQLVELRLPPLTSVFDASVVDAAIAKMPALTKLVLSQTPPVLARLVRNPQIAIELR